MRSQLIKTIIVEDESAAVNRLQKELSRLEGFQFEVLAAIESVGGTVEWIHENSDIDLIFMDIQLSDGLSFEIFNQIAVPAPVIFTTAYDEYALRAFKVNSIDYLLKPIRPEDLREAMDKYLERSTGKETDYLHQLMNLAKEFRPTTYRSSFLVSFRQKMLLIDINDVAYFFVKERGVFLKKKDGVEYVIEFFLDDLEKQLDPAQFYRANRQFLVARSAIKEIEPYFNGRLVLLMAPDTHTPVIISKEKATNFKRWADY